MKLFSHLIALGLAALVAFGCVEARAAATLLPNGENCFAALTPTSGGTAGTGTGLIGLLGTITGGSGGTTGTYGGVPLTGGSGSGGTANITVSGGAVTAVAIVNPGIAFIVGDTLSAASGNIGGVTGFSVPVSSITINQSLAGGTVAFYYPGTNLYKQTWFNSDQSSTHQNTNPVTLDANGCAIIYGIGSYRQVLQDSLGNTIWDQITTDTSANNNTFWAGLAAGTPNAITVTDPGFNATDGSVIQFIPLYTNTGTTTLTPTGFGTYSVVKDTSSGAVALTGGEIVAGAPSNVVSVVFSASQQNFHILNLVSTATASSPSIAPQGYLNLLGAANGGPVQGTSDVTAATTVYYTSIVGNQVSIWNGTSFSTLTFPELQIALTASAQGSNNIYDVCLFNNAGSVIGVFTPAWSTSTPGSGVRGTGGGTPQLAQEFGLWVNAVQITANNGSTNYTVPALQCTYVGSILVDATAGQVSAYRSVGQSRKFGVWNAYNRVPITLQVTDPASSWTYTATKTPQPSNNHSANSITTLVGLTQEDVDVKFTQTTSIGPNGTSSNIAGNMSFGIGVNSTTAISGTLAYEQLLLPIATQSTSVQLQTGTASYTQEPMLGANTFTAMEQVSSLTQAILTYYGQAAFMTLTAKWRG